ncbi:MBL fold metallo-hydrolase [Aureisphaera galaxeae]|uniref:MBL fold metallo-hydrolase n=1 Tax=Aureisphaera galaxeae TaxID=1538023 RepID=UPI0023508D07|nr:MBL fold metallo-hydrolase [Aureisphaera galaxeae]MDC8005997.1 MBL fold metallo-hydrolase [Aureisphaera galaxeae]
MRFVSFLLIIVLWGCQSGSEKEPSPATEPANDMIITDPAHLVVLGTLQDAGSPHIGCKKECCKALFENPDPLRKVVSLGLIDPNTDKYYLFEATPDISTQTKKLKFIAQNESELPHGVFLTHAHIGHYSGLMYLGKEATNAQKVPVYAMPRMKSFLETNGPWDQLVKNDNIEITEMQHQQPVQLSDAVSVTPFLVPHRDEYSETVGYIIEGPVKKALFIPDIDKWEKWGTSIIDVISEVDYAFLDATFYHGEEINTRDISQIPHPFIIESMELFGSLPPEEKQKVYFIHFNHTNPVLNPESDAYQSVIENGFKIALPHTLFAL